MNKIIAFDTETTGLDPARHEIIQIAGAVITDNRIRCWFDLRARPDKPENVEQAPLDVNGYTIEQILEFPKRAEMHAQLLEIWGEYIRKFDKDDKAYPLGYNVKFDIGMLSAHFEHQEDNYLGSWINWRDLDVSAPINWRLCQGKYPDLESRKLTSVCEYFGIEFWNAHDALCDIRATLQLAHKLGLLKDLDLDDGAPTHRNY